MGLFGRALIERSKSDPTHTRLSSLLNVINRDPCNIVSLTTGFRTQIWPLFDLVLHGQGVSHALTDPPFHILLFTTAVHVRAWATSRQ
jgi:hypothetical protein